MSSPVCFYLWFFQSTCCIWFVNVMFINMHNYVIIILLLFGLLYFFAQNSSNWASTAGFGRMFHNWFCFKSQTIQTNITVINWYWSILIILCIWAVKMLLIASLIREVVSWLNNSPSPCGCGAWSPAAPWPSGSDCAPCRRLGSQSRCPHHRWAEESAAWLQNSETDGEWKGLRTDSQADRQTQKWADRQTGWSRQTQVGRKTKTDRQLGTERERKRAESGMQIEVGQKSSQRHSSQWRSSTVSNSDKFKRIWQSFLLNSFHLPIGFLLTGRISNTNGNISVFDGWVMWGEARGLCSGFLAIQSHRTHSLHRCKSQKQ